MRDSWHCGFHLLKSVLLQIQRFNSSDDVKDHIYDVFYCTIRKITRSNKIILLSYFNTRVGRDHHIWQCVILLAKWVVIISSCFPYALNCACHHMWHVNDFLDASQVQTLEPHWLRHCLAPWLAWTANYSSHTWSGVLHW